MLIQISEITVNPGRRELVPENVKELADSISKLGLLNPITVDQGHTLIAGLHRLEAAKLLGWMEIECTVSSLEGLLAELAEVDENVVRKGLPPIDLGNLFLRRKELYEALHPETKRGGDRKSEKIKLRPAQFDLEKSFLADTAEKTGKAQRTIAEDLQMAKNLTPEAQAIIRKAGAKITKKNALKLSRLQPEQQQEAAGLLASQEIRSIEEYHLNQQEKCAEQDAADEEPQEKPEEAGPDALSPPAGESVRGTALFREIVADLKNADKDFSCTPDSFLAEIASFVQNFQKELDWYNMPYYEAVYPALTPEQFQNFRRQMDSICAAVQNLIHHVEVNVK